MNEEFTTLVEQSGKEFSTYGLSYQNDVIADNLNCFEFSSTYDCKAYGKNLGQITLNVPGKHNVQNSLACVCLGLHFGFDFPIIKESLETRRASMKFLVGIFGNIIICI